MNEEELMNDIWKNTHHFMMELANGEKLDLIETKIYKELLKKYVESEKARKEAIEFIKKLSIEQFDGGGYLKELYNIDYDAKEDLLNILDLAKGE